MGHTNENYLQIMAKWDLIDGIPKPIDKSKVQIPHMHHSQRSKDASRSNRGYRKLRGSDCMQTSQ